MKKSIIIVILLLFSLELSAQRQHAIFSVTPEQQRFNNYFLVVNEFDSALVYYEVGNFCYNDNNTKKWIYLDDSLNKRTGKFFQGSGVNGHCDDLAQLLKTESFYLPATSTNIEFYRNSIINTEKCNNPRAGSSNTSIAGVSDQSEFRIDIMDALTNNLLATIDSVVSSPADDPKNSKWSGTYPELTYHIADIPQNCKDKNVYIRIIPVRIGSSPYGMTAKSLESWVNLSALFDMERNYIDKNYNLDSLNTLFRNELITFLDTTKKIAGIPPPPKFYPPGFQYEYLDRYNTIPEFKKNSISDGDTTYFLINHDVEKKSFNNDIQDSELEITSVSPSFVFDKSELYFKISSGEGDNIELFITDIKGTKLIDVFKGRVDKGISTFFLKTNDFAQGAYFLNAVSVSRQIWKTKKFGIVR